MRIALVSTPFIRVPPAGYGGTELFCYVLGEELQHRGHDVTLFTTGDSDTSCRRRALYGRAEWPPQAADEVNHVAWAMHETVREHFDVIHLNSPLALPLTRFVKTPAVYTIHHCQEASLSRLLRAHPDVLYAAISQRQLDLETPLYHAAVVHHGLRADAYPPGAADHGYVLHLGRYAPEKGTHVAIDVARAAGVPIIVAGRAHPQDADYHARELELRFQRDGVIEVGEADHGRKVELMRGARAFLLPLDWEEPFGLVVAEAMLCGTPVIAFARGSLPEIIDEGVTGFLIPPGDVDAMTRRVRGLDGFDREACAKRARERFSASAMATRYEEVYRRAVALAFRRRRHAA